MDNQIQTNQKLEVSEITKILENINIVKIFLDTNVIIGYLNSNSPFHLEAKTAIEGLKAKKVWFIIPHLVIGEFIAHRSLISKKISIKEALKILNKFDKDIKQRLVGGTPLNLQNITDFYKKHSKHTKLTNAGFADFIILAEANEIKDARILTCDKGMYSCGKSIFREKIYYLPNQTKKVKSDYPRLMSEIQNNFK